MNTEDQETELAKRIINSLLRDFFAAIAASSIHADDFDRVAALAYAQADALMRRSHTPALIEQLKKL